MALGTAAFAQAWWSFVRTIGPDSRLRLAPTPSGFLHIGNAVNFTLNWLGARLCPGARLLLRIDDIDVERRRPEYVQNIFDTLHWLQLDWDEGPLSALELEREWSQQKRLPLYEAALQALREQQCLFACGKSRRQLRLFGGDYPDHFRNQACSLEDPDVAWRIRTPRPCPPEQLPPDFIVRRRDGIPAYQLVSAVDDLHFKVTHVIRGSDLEPSTRAQQYLARCAGWSAFERIRFLHHPLLTDAAGNKLSKSAGARALFVQAPLAASPTAVFHVVAQWIGLTIQPSSASELLAAAREYLSPCR